MARPRGSLVSDREPEVRESGKTGRAWAAPSTLRLERVSGSGASGGLAHRRAARASGVAFIEIVRAALLGLLGMAVFALSLLVTPPFTGTLTNPADGFEPPACGSCPHRL